MIDIIPGINETEYEEIEKKVGEVAPYVEWIQLDFSDGTLLPTFTFFDIPKLKTLLSSYSDHKNLAFEAHLMVSNPIKYLKPLSDAGFKRIILHVESVEPRLFLDEAEYESVEVGIALDAATEIEEVEPYLDAVDFVLVMTVEAGASGQVFLPETVEKIKQIHENYPDLPVEVDGGINDQTSKIVREAGATRLVSTSYIFRNPRHIPASIENLKG